MGKSLAVLSNKPDNLSNESCKIFLPRYYLRIYQRRVARYPSQTGSRKHFIVFVAPYNLALLSDTIYIGDSDVDMQFAHNAKSHCGRCLLGLSRQKEELKKSGANILLEILKILHGSCKKLRSA